MRTHLGENRRRKLYHRKREKDFLPCQRTHLFGEECSSRLASKHPHEVSVPLLAKHPGCLDARLDEREQSLPN